MLATSPTKMLTCKQTGDFELKHARNVERYFMGPSNLWGLAINFL
jgi:hypothetical protein